MFGCERWVCFAGWRRGHVIGAHRSRVHPSHPHSALSHRTRSAWGRRSHRRTWTPAVRGRGGGKHLQHAQAQTPRTGRLMARDWTVTVNVEERLDSGKSRFQATIAPPQSVIQTQTPSSEINSTRSNNNEAGIWQKQEKFHKLAYRCNTMIFTAHAKAGYGRDKKNHESKVSHARRPPLLQSVRRREMTQEALLPAIEFAYETFRKYLLFIRFALYHLIASVP